MQHDPSLRVIAVVGPPIRVEFDRATLAGRVAAPAGHDHVAAAVLEAVDPERVIAQASSLAKVGDLATALAIIDLVALAPGDDPVVAEARHHKADWCEQLAGNSQVFVSIGLYRSSAALLREGATRWSQVGEEGLPT